MVTDQNHSSDISSEQEVIRRTEKIARLLEAYKQNAEAYSALSSIREALKKQFEDCHPQYNTLEKRVKRLEKDIRSLKIELGDLDECVDRETVVDLIHKIVPILINEKSKGSAYSSKSSEDSDSVEIIERSHGYQVTQVEMLKIGKKNGAKSSGYSWLFLAILGYSWLFLAVFGCFWLFTN